MVRLVTVLLVIRLVTILLRRLQRTDQACQKGVLFVQQPLLMGVVMLLVMTISLQAFAKVLTPDDSPSKHVWVTSLFTNS